MSEHIHDFDSNGNCDCGETWAGERAKQFDALVRVVEKLLPLYYNYKGHDTACEVFHYGLPCTCGADEARALLAKIRGEKC